MDVKGCVLIATLLVFINVHVVLCDKCSPYGKTREPTSKYITTYESTRKSRGGSWWRRTVYYYELVSIKTHVCEDGYRGIPPDCKPVCHDEALKSACNRYEGRTVEKDKSIITCSGGACVAPNTCESCNLGYYADNGEWDESDKGYCRACQAIDNCNILNCHNGDTSRCDWCEGEVIYPLPGYYAYSRHNDQSKCERACSWRSGARCYPGSCGTLPLLSTCQCADGFGSNNTDCSTFQSNVDETLKPQILEPEMLLKGSSSSPMLIVPDPAHKDRKLWTNILDWTTVDIGGTGTFKVNNMPTEVHSYIKTDTTKIGIKTVYLNAVLKRGSVEYSLSRQKSCSFIDTCSLKETNTSLSRTPWTFAIPLTHLDIITYTISTSNGGQVDYFNRENKRVERYSINGITVSKSFQLEVDVYPPQHCFEDVPKCQIDPLVVPDFIKQSTFEVSWDGWTDINSGLHKFHIKVSLLGVKDKAAENPKLSLSNYPFIETYVESTETTASVTVTRSGPYQCEIVTEDWAGNVKKARRIFIFDDVSTVSLCSDPPYVTTADKQTDYKWINKHAGSIEVTWPDRFINELHHNNGWLSEVDTQEDISKDLEDTTGLSLRTLDEIHNIQGIVNFTIGYIENYGFGTTITEHDYIPVPEKYFDDQKMIINEDLEDGKQITFLIRGYDVMGNYGEDNATVTIDLSPPEISNLWLTKGDMLNISVHSIKELDEITFEWEVVDVHSGINNISWRLVDYLHHDVIHGTAHETPQGDAASLEDCQTKYGHYARGPNCYCTPFNGCFHRHYQVKPQISATSDNGIFHNMSSGAHESDYFIEITATNHAFLTTVHDVKITIDTSPPHKGTVHDGLDTQPEVDFQQSLNLSSHWSGFFDKESGVWFYMYGYGHSCIDQSEFDLDFVVQPTSLTKTYSKTGYFTASTPGTYYVTVAAYNHALDHSDPVCSDGVTIDTIGADISEVVIKGAVTNRRLVKNSGNKVWVLYEDRTIVEITNTTQICVDKASLISADTIMTLPERRFPNGTKRGIKTYSICDDIKENQNNLLIFITSNAILDVSWNVTYSSGIHDYEVGIASGPILEPDKHSFQSTKQHTHTRIYHPNIWDGEEFYILVKAITKAAVETISMVGPFAVDTTPPDFNGVISVVLESEYLLAYWEAGAFVDHGDPSSLSMEVAIGTDKLRTDVLSYEAVSDGGSCTDTSSCTAIKIADLQWGMHGQQVYYVTIKATNAVGLSTVASSEAYVHNVGLAAHGVVVDVNKHSALTSDDIDYQTATDVLTVRWSGFQHAHLDVKFYACFTTSATNDNINCEPTVVPQEHTFTGLNLIPYSTYYQSVIAETVVGNVTVSSDGVTIVIEGDSLLGVLVYDGQPCDTNIDTSFDPNTSHHLEDYHMPCVDDVNYQSSTNVLHAYWDIPEISKHYIQDVHWAVEIRAPMADFWTEFRNYEHIRTSYKVTESNLFLQPGRKYRIAVKFCATHYCYKPVYSNGVTIISNPPSTGQIEVEHTNDNNMLSATMDLFWDSDIEDLDERKFVIDHYEWAITDNSHDGRLVSDWARIPITQTSNTQVSFNLNLQASITLTKCWKLSVRGYSKSGMTSTVSSDIKACDDMHTRVNLIIDAMGEPVLSAGSKGVIHDGQPIALEENNIWTVVDQDYTPYQNIISAVWPSLRYKQYTWAVLKVSEEDPSVFYRSEIQPLDDPCSHPDVVMCGITDNEYINAIFNAESGYLQHGQRYIMCIHANATDNVYTKWELQLNETSLCSDGITVDLTPPTEQPVWIGETIGIKYQSSTTDLTVNWKSFIDVEEEGNSVHSSGIAFYQIALGSSHGGVDISDFIDVGVTNHYTFHDLLLQNGHSYYATVRAQDFTNQTSMSTSSSVKIDTSPPDVTTNQITLDTRHITSTSVSACWTGMFKDAESGVEYYTWAVGTQPGYEDIMPHTKVVDECAETDNQTPLALIEGHAYYVTVKAYNNVGLFSIAVSWAFVVDMSPPTPGYVYDGYCDSDKPCQDVDFQTSDSVIEAYWTDFYENQGTLKDYYTYAGSCKGCDNVMTTQLVGITNAIVIDKLQMSEGITYYVTVTACNTADLCTSVSSDGFMIDSSPPIAGRVLDGVNGLDIEYQASRLCISAEWYGFSDPQSELSNYVWRVGTTSGENDILIDTDLHLEQKGFVFDLSLISGDQLPVGVRIYVTVRAYNKAGMFIESTSNGFIVDDNGPLFTRNITHVRIGSILPKTSVLKSVLKVSWEVEDSDSAIEHQFLSISSHIGGDFNLSSLQVEGIVRDYTFTGLDLHDGSRYDVTVMSCNGAKLCTESVVTDIFVDSSPPSPGTFAINTDHASVLNRKPDSWMEWSNIFIRLAWLGFEDEHSGITKYMINVGSTYMGNDLNKVPGTPYEVDHAVGDFSHDEGEVQVEQIWTQSMSSVQHVFVSLWAENGVELASDILHGQFELVYGGLLKLVRRCSAQTCYGHCVCAPHGQLCSINHQTECMVADTTYDSLTVKAYIDLTFPEDLPILRHSPINSLIAAKWEITSSKGKPPLWYEYSLGYSRNDEPTGVFDEAYERVWFDAGRKTSWIVSLSSGRVLEKTTQYSFFVRAWYDANTYQIFKSANVKMHSTPPKLVKVRGRQVKEITPGSDRDLDFIDINRDMAVNWFGLFTNLDESLSKYQLYISTSLGGHDVHILSKDISPDVTEFTISGLDFKEGTKYYSVVQAFNLAGLHTTASSDGFTVDNSPPLPGIVNDGEGLVDIHAWRSSKVVPMHWHGFSDIASGIRGYEACVSSDNVKLECDIQQMTFVGIGTKTSFSLDHDVPDGTVLYSVVKAIDMVGHVSEPVVSNGFVIDTNPPSRLVDVSYSENLVSNPSFEIAQLNHTLEEVYDGIECETHIPSDWAISDSSCLFTVQADIVVDLPDGRNYIVLNGELSQTVYLSEGKYRLTFYTSHLNMPGNTISNNEGYVEMNEERHVFIIYEKPGNFENANINLSWQKHTYYFHIVQNTNATLTFISLGKTFIAIDDANLDKREHVISSEIHQAATGHVNAHTMFIHDWSSIHAEWNFIDEESGILEYMWAIGTVEGGTQLLDFTSVGRRTFAFTSSLHLSHDTTVYVTIVAINGVGISTVSYSHPLLIDLTIPTFEWLYDGPEIGHDINFQKERNVSVNWNITDTDSGITACSWAAGYEIGDTSLLEYTDINPNSNHASMVLTDTISPQSTIYVSLKCTNGAGLVAVASTNGVSIINEAPSIDEVLIQVLATSTTVYPPHGHYHGDRTEVKIRWTGFHDIDGIDSYLISLEGGGISMTEFVTGTTFGFNYASFTNLNLADGNHTVSVIAENQLHMYSQKQIAHVYVLTEPPIVTGNVITTEWDKVTDTLSAAWSSVFISDHPLYYEVTVGQVDGGNGDMIQWQETTDTTLALVLDTENIVASGINVRVAVKAISHCGLYSSVYNDFYIGL